MWKHNKKFKGKAFISQYDKGTKANDRSFVLIYGGIKKSYESWQAAVKDGWIKVK